jgi:hypothetical protein
MLLDHAAQSVVDGEEPHRQLGFVVGGERAAGQEAQPIAVDRHHAPAGAAEAGIDAEDANRSAHGHALIALATIRA